MAPRVTLAIQAAKATLAIQERRVTPAILVILVILVHPVVWASI